MREKKILFPQIVEEMKKRKQTQKDVADLLGLDSSQVSRKISGAIDWSIGDVEVLCDYYNMDFEDLFRRKENKNENI